MESYRMAQVIARWAVGLAVAATAVAAPLFLSAEHQRASRAVAGFDVTEKTIPELQAGMQAGKVTSRQLVEIYLARIQAYDREGPRLNALIALNPGALQTAQALDDERRLHGARGPLHGIPVVIKDNYETTDIPTTGGSVALAGFETGRDAFQVRKLKEAGAVIVGKTNLHELASGITTISSLGGQTRNPYDPVRSPGGSSGGTGAAVAANFAAAGMGSDTCGSIRIPAANNSLFGLRGTLGLSSRDGIIPLSHTQDIGGPLARSVTDLAIMLDATVGVDAADAATAVSEGHVPRSYRDALTAEGLKDARIGILKSLFGSAPEDDEVGAIVRNSLDAMRRQGAKAIDVTIAGLDEPLRGSSVIDAEFKFDLMDYLGRHPNAPVHSLADILERGEYDATLEANFRRRNAVESRETENYRRALGRRVVVRNLVLAAMDEQKLDAIAYPTLRRKPAMIGESQAGNNCQLSASSGLPAISMPAGFTADGLPIGVELLGAPWRELQLLKMAFAYEQATHVRRPPATTPALVNGKRPGPTSFMVSVGHAKASFRYDATTGRLVYRIAELGADVIAVAIHRGQNGGTGPVVVSLLNAAARNGSGDTILPAADREALQDGRLYLVVKTRPSSDPVLRTQIRTGR